MGPQKTELQQVGLQEEELQEEELRRAEAKRQRKETAMRHLKKVLSLSHGDMFDN